MYTTARRLTVNYNRKKTTTANQLCPLPHTARQYNFSVKHTNTQKLRQITLTTLYKSQFEKSNPKRKANECTQRKEDQRQLQQKEDCNGNKLQQKENFNGKPTLPTTSHCKAIHFFSETH